MLTNYMTVPAAIRELEKIEIVRHIDREHSLDYAVAATQKSILKAFDQAEPNVRKQAADLNEDLKSLQYEGGIAMARRKLSIDDKIEQQKLVVS